MKKLFLLSSVCAAALLTACSNDEPINNGGEISDGTPRYLSVNIVSNSGSDTRAEGDVTPGGPDFGTDEQPVSQYEEGLSKENDVTKVRFYFFDAQGNPANVKNGSNVNFFDWEQTPENQFGNQGATLPNVEKILNATIVISTKDGDTFPSQMLAVVNPRANLGNQARTLEQIRSINADYATYANGGLISATGETNSSLNLNGKSYFPMCNSVYAENGQRITATKISPEHYMTSEKLAKENPVDVYVERNVAKVRVALELDPAEMTFENGMIALKDKERNPIIIDGEQIYLKLEGWNVTADMNQSYLSKRFAQNLSDWDNLGFIWNYPEFHRSYWAFQSNTSNCRYGTYEVASAQEFYDGTDKTKGYTYCNENTTAQGIADILKKNTKIILAGKLCKQDETPVTICEYYGIKYVDDENQTNLKKAVLRYITDNGTKNYYRLGLDQDGKEAYYSLSVNDITFRYAKAAVDGQDIKGLYYVIPTLVPEVRNVQWFTTDDGDADNEVSYTVIENLLATSQHAKIWNEGMTYYYADINHFGTDKIGDQTVQRRGVVRNHIYDMSINTIYGLGTPVWDETVKIIPEKTQDEDTYIGAQIHILSWRIVNNKVNLEW